MVEVRLCWTGSQCLPVIDNEYSRLHMQRENTSDFCGNTLRNFLVYSAKVHTIFYNLRV